MPFVYSDSYFADIGLHVFPIIKYREVYKALIAGGQPPEVFHAPPLSTHEQLLAVHTNAYLDDLEHLHWTQRTASSELPISEEIVRLFKLACGGTLLASELALRERWCVHLAGGFHHAFADKAEGFCYLNDLAVAAQNLLNDSRCERVAVIDCDLHQGNGTAHIFRAQPDIFTFSMHQRDLYPIKQKSDVDVHLPNDTSDAEYLGYLTEHVPEILDSFQPDLVLYQAGADPYFDDQLGSLGLTFDGLEQRDRFIFDSCQSRRIPVAVTLGGGYAFNTDHTVQIHVNTCLTALSVWDS